MANPNWIAGEASPNPSGRPKSIFQDYTPRAAHFLQTLTTAEIIGLSVDLEKLDNEYSSFDGLVLRHLGNTLRKGNDEFASTERERLMDRTVGKATQKHAGDDDLPGIQINHSADDLDVLRQFVKDEGESK